MLIPALTRIVDETLDLKIRFLKSLIPFIDSLSSNGDLGYNILKNMFKIQLKLKRQYYKNINSNIKIMFVFF